VQKKKERHILKYHQWIIYFHRLKISQEIGEILTPHCASISTAITIATFIATNMLPRIKVGMCRQFLHLSKGTRMSNVPCSFK
jgi:hypothetical protein